MGNACCGRKKTKKKIVLLLVGLDNAGKTVAAKGLAGEPIEDVVPTVGFHTVTLRYKEFLVKIYDLGGAANFRGIWHKYFVDAHGVIFVLDSSDSERIQEAEEVLKSVICHEKISGKPLLFLANKQDSENALDEIDLNEHFHFEEIVNHAQCPTLVETCSATELKNKNQIDAGLLKGYNWIINYINRNYDNLNDRVLGDIAQQELEEKRIRDEIILRIKTMREKEVAKDQDAIELYSEYTKKLENENQNGNIDNLCNGALKNKERPKSARELIRDQLIKSDQIFSNKNCKTVPFNSFGVPRSVEVKRKVGAHDRRIKSASNVDKYLRKLSNSVVPLPETNGDVNLTEFVSNDDKNKLNNISLPIDLSPKIYIKKSYNFSRFNSDHDNDISIINID